MNRDYEQPGSVVMKLNRFRATGLAVNPFGVYLVCVPSTLVSDRCTREQLLLTLSESLADIVHTSQSSIICASQHRCCDPPLSARGRRHGEICVQHRAGRIQQHSVRRAWAVSPWSCLLIPCRSQQAISWTWQLLASTMAFIFTGCVVEAQHIHIGHEGTLHAIFVCHVFSTE